MPLSSARPFARRFAGGTLMPIRLVTLGLLAAAAACLAMAPARAVTIDMVTVGDPGNAADTTGYGRVDHAYQIGKHEITIGQYAEFLNAVAKGDIYDLYNPTMGTNGNIRGISRTGGYGSYVYTVMTNGGSSAVSATFFL